MVIELSKRRLRLLAFATSFPLLLTTLSLLGWSVTPRDAMNEPLLLSPGLKSTLEYPAQASAGNDDQRQVTQVVSRLVEIDCVSQTAQRGRGVVQLQVGREVEP